MVRGRAVTPLVTVVLLAACSSAPEITQADHDTCTSAREFWDSAFTPANMYTSVIEQTQQAQVDRSVLRSSVPAELSSYTPDNDRLVRAVDRARDDADAWQESFSRDAVTTGSFPALLDVCDDLGA